MRTAFLRALESPDKGSAIAPRQEGRGASAQRFNIDPVVFREIPGSPFAYWVKEGVRRLFRAMRGFQDGARSVHKGMATANDARFVRASWEVPFPHSEKRWFGFAKGGPF